MLVVQLAKWLQLPEVAVQPGDSNRWLNTTKTFTLEKAQKRYDQTAGRCGFKRQGIAGPYVLHLNYQKDGVAEPQNDKLSCLSEVKSNSAFVEPLILTT